MIDRLGDEGATQHFTPDDSWHVMLHIGQRQSSPMPVLSKAAGLTSMDRRTHATAETSLLLVRPG